MNVSAKTDIGLFRESNQDLFEYGTFDTGDCWAIVCDGMGGVSGGQVASALCVEKVSAAIKRGYRKNISIKSAKNLLQSAISVANTVIYDKACSDKDLTGMGTTIVVAIVIKNVALIAHVGDSRAYVVTDSSIRQITKDHSLVQMMVDNGKITEEEAKTHPEKNIITRAVGVVNFVDVDFDIESLEEGKKLLLCTDGLSGSLENNEMLDLINNYRNSSIEKLVEKALENGSRDNITVVLMDAEIQGE